MQIVESFDNACRVEPSGCIIKVPAISQNCPQLAAKAALHQHVQVLSVFERLEQFHDEITIRLAHNLLFGHDVLLLSRLDNLRFLHLLQGKRT